MTCLTLPLFPLFPLFPPSVHVAEVSEPTPAEPTPAEPTPAEPTPGAEMREAAAAPVAVSIPSPSMPTARAARDLDDLVVSRRTSLVAPIRYLQQREHACGPHLGAAIARPGPIND